ncbi:hypothetical protein K7X08_015115 [Anisodus acutangulus]|uniref:Uncharacterized protein n=1 Tax=Anisodus acutangulus TaxID=402998 RepID=A0A9Q1L3V7_9SOLA|nr:hypothetical protein K7X08_015115 [Anisodus acutangulus]
MYKDDPPPESPAIKGMRFLIITVTMSTSSKLRSVENVVADDEADIEQEDKKFDDRDESDNKREESDGSADHNDDGAKEGDEVDVGENDEDELNIDGDEVDLVDDDKADGEKGGDGVIAVEEENVDGESKAEESDEGIGDQNYGKKEQGTTIENYPWGRKIFEFLLDVLQKDMKQPVLN